MKLSIAIVTLGLPFHGDTLKTGALGGSETAAISVAKALADRGHEVYVFCNCEKPGTYDGVIYYHHQDFQKQAAVIGWDVLIASRWMEFLTMRSFAGLRILWLHDTLVDHGRALSQCWQTDGLFLLSDYHIENYTKGRTERETKESKLHQFKHGMWKTSNGIDHELVKTNLREKVPGKVIYTSRPERGLHYLLQFIMPKIWQQRPDVKLHYANYSLQGMQVPEHVRQVSAVCEQLTQRYNANGPRVIKLGHLTKAELYQEMSSAELLLYPTDFPEISCLTAMEAAQCGTPIISTRDFALRETVKSGKTGYLIAGHPTDPTYQEKFVRKALHLLNNTSAREKMSANGPEWNRSQGYHWDIVAERWEGKFREMMESRWKDNSRGVVRELIRQSDLIPAEALATEIGDKELVAEVQGAINGVFPQVPTTTEEAKKTMESTFARYSKSIELLQVRGLDPTKVKEIWDFGADRFSLALAAPKFFPEATGVAVSPDDDVLDHIKQYAERGNLSERVKTVQADGFETIDGDSRPDILFLGGVLENAEDPHKLLQEAINFTKPGGWVLVNSSYGGKSNRLRDVTHHRLWNFSMFDWKSMLMDTYEGHTSFFREEFTTSGDIVGWWVVAIPVPEEGDRPVLNPPAVQHRKLATRPYQGIACCMIAYNAEEWITKCMKHVRPYVDKICVVLDTKTNDRTKEFADPYVDEWRESDFEDFAQQRNVSIAGHDEEWILWIDTDEMLIDGHQLVKYLHSPLYEGYALRQCHLQLDVHGNEDHPVRLLRNRPNYRFVGCIHEHCEDISRGPDSMIEPAVPVPDCPLAHYGYQNEVQRRNKCSHRNMELLQKDLRVNPDRQLNKVLLMRDYLNMIKWSVEANAIRKGQPIMRRGSREHQMAEACISTYYEFLARPDDKYHALGFPMYQEALGMMSASQIPFGDRRAPPFCVRLKMQAAVGAVPEDAPADPKKPTHRWFVDHVEFEDFMQKQTKQLLAQLGHISSENLEEELYTTPEIDYEYVESQHELLAVGTASIEQYTGRLLK